MHARLRALFAPEDAPAGGPPAPATPPAPAAAATDADAASAAAAVLAKRKAEAEAERRDDGPVRMVDLHDLDTGLRGELRELRARLDGARSSAAPVAAVPSAAPARRSGGGGLLVVLLAVLGVLAFLGTRKGTP